MKKTRPKVRISRALGFAITEKAARIMEKRSSTPGQHGMGRKKSPSVYKIQLLEKQKLKHSYNLSEKQLKTYFDKATHSKRNTGSVLLEILELRVDAAVYRMGFAKTIYAARQYVTHGHFVINGKKIKTPSLLLKLNDELSVNEASKSHPQIFEALTKKIETPEYFEVNKVKMSGILKSLPDRKQIPVHLNEQLVVEYYSR